MDVPSRESETGGLLESDPVNHGLYRVPSFPKST